MAGRSYCSSVTSYECEAPAGIRGGGGYAGLPGVRRSALLTCGYCGEPVCKQCSTEVDGKPVCDSHSEGELLDWIGPLDTLT